MRWSRASGASGHVETVIFVDIDGVLNVSLRDVAGAPLLFSDRNVELALSMAAEHNNTGGDAETCSTNDSRIDKLLSTNSRPIGHGEDSTYAKLITRAPSNVCDLLVARLAELIRAAGPYRTVVLSSLWRRPQYEARVRNLEKQISLFLGEPFTFDARTALVAEVDSQDRLRLIGDFVAKACQRGNSPRKAPPRRLRVLVLEDFCSSPLGGWSCGGIQVETTRDVERYIQLRGQEAAELDVELVHTYDEWITSAGVTVQAGVGLTMEHFCKATQFLGRGGCDFCSGTDDAGSSTGSEDTLLGMAAAAAAAAALRPMPVVPLKQRTAHMESRWLGCLSSLRPCLAVA